MSEAPHIPDGIVAVQRTGDPGQMRTCGRHRHVGHVLARSADPGALSAFDPDLLPNRNCELWPVFFARPVTCEVAEMTWA
jgi:hypothetical protein